MNNYFMFIFIVLGSSNSSSHSFKEADIKDLIKLGFSREQVIVIK